MKYFFIGIKGSGMSSLALILNGLDNEVMGSDVEKYYFTQNNLEKEKIKLYNFGEYDFNNNIDEVIIGNSFDLEHIDAINALEKNLKIITYKDKLNEIVKEKNSIAISGTNGKTTTTGMVQASLKDLDPSFLIGDGTGYGNKDSDIFIFEACEYKETFLAYDPKYLLINNIEYDHPDFFKDLDHVIEVFQKFTNKSRQIIVNADDHNAMRIIHKNRATFGIYNKKAELFASNIKYLNTGIEFDLHYKGEFLKEKILLPFFGEYMLYNSLATILINLLLKRDINLIIENLSEFDGVNRRFQIELISKMKNIKLLDDYAHHPTAINLTHEALEQKYPNDSKIVIFQPHTISRTSSFLDEFSDALGKFDYVMIDDIFLAAREKKIEIKDNILEEDLKKKYPEKLKKYSEFDFSSVNNTIICLLGAGDVDKKYKQDLKNKYK